jgi:two-component system sensor histidine kinase HydH
VAAVLFIAAGLGGWTVTHRLEQAEQRRRLAELGEVSALLAHEIRNPLAAIKGAVQYLQAEVKGPSAEYVDLVLREIARLDAALSDVQYFVKPLQVDGQLTDLNALVEDVARAHGVQAATTPGLPAVRADARLIRQVLVNLIKNALETGAPSVRVETRAEGSSAVIAVRDSGPGIPDDVADRLFQPYFTTKTRGMGLGLALSRRIAEAHGGSLDAENVDGGAEFRLELPIARE